MASLGLYPFRFSILLSLRFFPFIDALASMKENMLMSLLERNLLMFDELFDDTIANLIFLSFNKVISSFIPGTNLLSSTNSEAISRDSLYILGILCTGIPNSNNRFNLGFDFNFRISSFDSCFKLYRSEIR
jgi:hypothetical protein